MSSITVVVPSRTTAAESRRNIRDHVPIFFSFFYVRHRLDQDAAAAQTLEVPGAESDRLTSSLSSRCLESDERSSELP
ncbi:unnamed protein product [Sphagnum troendelagicum]